MNPRAQQSMQPLALVASIHINRNRIFNPIKHAPAFERWILWNYSVLQSQRPEGVAPILSAKDVQGKLLAEAKVFA